MSVKIRLRRVGAKKQPSYRVVIADSHAPRDGRFIESIGFYNPRTKPTTITIDAEKAHKWIGNGALPTDSVASLLYRAGIIDMRRERFRVGAPMGTETPTPAEETVAEEAPTRGRGRTKAAAQSTKEIKAAAAAEPVTAEPEPATTGALDVVAADGVDVPEATVAEEATAAPLEASVDDAQKPSRARTPRAKAVETEELSSENSETATSTGEE